jgi:FK506-binding protein 2
MQFLKSLPTAVSFLLLASLSAPVFASDAVEIEVLHLPTVCERKTKVGDKIDVHYEGTLASDGSTFDTSYTRGQPLSFTVGKGQVIKG